VYSFFALWVVGSTLRNGSWLHPRVLWRPATAAAAAAAAGASDVIAAAAAAAPFTMPSIYVGRLKVEEEKASSSTVCVGRA